MAKGQQLSLNRPYVRPLDLVRMGIGRQPAPRPGLLGTLGLRPRGNLGTFAVLYGNGRFHDVLFADNPINPGDHAHPCPSPRGTR